jgi:hypothetical protein
VHILMRPNGERVILKRERGGNVEEEALALLARLRKVYLTGAHLVPAEIELRRRVDALASRVKAKRVRRSRGKRQ